MKWNVSVVRLIVVISGEIIKEMPDLVASGTSYIKTCKWDTYIKTCIIGMKGVGQLSF